MASSWTTPFLVSWQRRLDDSALGRSHFNPLGNYSLVISQGTRQERGFVWEKKEHAEVSNTLASDKLYDLPFGITTFLSSYSWVRLIPFCPWKGENNDEASMVQHQPGEDLCDDAGE